MILTMKTGILGFVNSAINTGSNDFKVLDELTNRLKYVMETLGVK